MAESKSRAELIEKRDNLQRQVDLLTVRAKSTGRVVARNLGALVGQFVSIGQTLMILGAEDQKELQISIEQSDLDAFRSSISRRLAVRIKSGRRLADGARLQRVDPKAMRLLSHPALAATAGGPLNVKQRTPDEHQAAGAAAQLELANPRFTAVAALSPASARTLRAGELAMVRLGDANFTIRQRLGLLVKLFIQQLMGGPA